MKKNLYVVMGIICLVVGAALAAVLVYNRSQRTADGTQGLTGSMAPESTQNAQNTTMNEYLYRDGAPALGPSTVKVQVVEFLDPECESCRLMHPYVKSVLKDYDGRIRYTLRYMPFHQNSALAASWLEAAREQDKYWESLDVLFERQPEWADHQSPKPDLIPSILKGVGVDIQKAESARLNPSIMERILRDKEDGMKLGVNGTPSFFVNGRMLQELGDAPLRAAIEQALSSTPAN